MFFRGETLRVVGQSIPATAALPIDTGQQFDPHVTSVVRRTEDDEVGFDPLGFGQHDAVEVQEVGPGIMTNAGVDESAGIRRQERVVLVEAFDHQVRHSDEIEAVVGLAVVRKSEMDRADFEVRDRRRSERT